MKIPRKTEIPHKLAMYKLLDALLANPLTATSLYFKGGTCAAMLGYLDRFSVDLDFDLLDTSQRDTLRDEIHKIVDKLGFEIKDESKNHLQFFLKYRDVENQRNTLKLEISDIVSKENVYKKLHLIELDRYCQAQTIETMFANKLVALKARWEEGKSIAARDLYDIYYFFNQGHNINSKVIEDLRSKSLQDYSLELVDFIQIHITDKLLLEDLNPLMDATKLKKILPHIKDQTILALKSL